MTEQPTPAGLAAQAAEAIRSLNHATIRNTAAVLPYPGDIASVVSHLQALARRLPQALDQLRRRLDQLAAEGDLYSDDQPEAWAPRVTGADMSLRDAGQAAWALAEALTEAGSDLFHLGVHERAADR